MATYPTAPMAAHIVGPKDSNTSFMIDGDLEKDKSFGVVSTVRPLSAMSDYMTDSEASRPNSGIIVTSDVLASGDADPFNWSAGKKAFHVSLPSFMSLVTTLISSAYVPGTFIMEADLHTSFESVMGGFSAYIFGLGIGAIFWGPISEVYGRKIVYITSLPLCGLFIMTTGFSHNIAGVIVSRLLSGICGIGPVSAAPGTLTDIFTREQVALPTALFVLTPFLGPALAPPLSAYVMTWKGLDSWRWMCWIEIFILISCWLPAFFMSETNKQVILARRAEKAGLQAPASPTEGKPATAVIMYYLNITLFRPVQMLFTESIVLCFSAYVSFNFALLYSFFAAFEWAWVTYYQFSGHETGLTFFGIAVGCFLGLILLIILTVVHTKPHLAKHAHLGTVAQPEFRLVPAMIGGCLLPCSLFLYGWSVYYQLHWVVPVIGEAMFAMGNFVVFMSTVVYFSDIYTPVGFVASALAANTLLRYLLAGIFPLFSVQMFEHLKVQWAASLLAFVSIGLAAMPFVFYRWGPALRKRSAYSSGAVKAEM